MGKKTEFLYLSEEDIIKAGALDYARCIDVEEEIFELLSKGDYVMGGDKQNSHGIYVKFPKESPFPNMPLDAPDRRFMAMPAYVGGRFNVAGQKWYGSNIINPQRGLPRSILMVMLNDADTCEPLCLMSGNLISSVRTGCVPGVATRHLAKKSAEVCTCIGAGPVIVAASSVKPVNLENDWLKPGSLIMFTGRRNIDEAYFSSAKIIWDNAKMHDVYYDDHMALPEEQRFINGISVQIYRMCFEGKLPPVIEQTSLGDIIGGTKEGRKDDEERICFVTGGMPVWDVGWGFELYESAKKKGLGQSLTLWDDPYLANNLLRYIFSKKRATYEMYR